MEPFGAVQLTDKRTALLRGSSSQPVHGPDESGCTSPHPRPRSRLLDEAQQEYGLPPAAYPSSYRPEPFAHFILPIFFCCRPCTTSGSWPQQPATSGFDATGRREDEIHSPCTVAVLSPAPPPCRTGRRRSDPRGSRCQCSGAMRLRSGGRRTRLGSYARC